MKWNWIRLSLALNLGLGIVVLWRVWAAAIASPPLAPRAVMEDLELKPSTPLSDRSPAPTEKWSRIQSKDLRQYVRNLESIGCPRETIQSILTAELDQRFNQRLAELSVNTNFWMTARLRQLWQEQIRQQRRELVEELQTTMKDLLDLDWVPPQARDDDDDDFVVHVAYMCGHLTDRQILELGELLIQYGWRGPKQPSFGITGPEDRAAREASAAEFHGRLGQILSPEEREEAVLRMHAVSLVDVWSVADQFGSDLTGAELREMVRIIKGDADPFEDFLGLDREESPMDPVREQAKDAAVRALLGEDRFRAYAAAQDFDFRFHNRFVTRELGLPTSTSVTLHDMRRAAEARARQVRRDRALSEEQRLSALERIQSDVVSELTAVLDGTSRQAYLKGQREWIDRLKKP